MDSLTHTHCAGASACPEPCAGALRAAIEADQSLLDDLGRMLVDLDVYDLWVTVRDELDRKREALAAIEAA